MSFDKIEFVKPNDILQGGFNPNLPSEITVQEQLLYSIANNLAILNNNLINSGALQNLALLGDLLQEVFISKWNGENHSVFKVPEGASHHMEQSVFTGNLGNYFSAMSGVGISQILSNHMQLDRQLWQTKDTSAIVNQAASTYSFNVPVPTVNVSSSPATVNVNSTAPVVNNNVPVPHVTNNVEVASAVPDITVNATAPVVNNNVPVPSVTNEVTVQSATPTIEVNATAPVVNVSSSPATVNVSSTAPIVNNTVPVPSVTNEVTVQSAVPAVNVSSSPATVNVSPAVNVDAYNDTALIAKLEQVREVLENAFNTSEDVGLADLLEDCLMSEVDTEQKMGLADIVFERDNVNFIDYPSDVLIEPSTTTKLKI